MTDCLGRYIGKLVSQGDIKGLQPSSQPLTCSHGQFVDDTIFMGKVDVKEARNLKKALNLYSYALGQLINWNKRSFFLLIPLFQDKTKLLKF